MAILSTVRTSYRTGRAADRPKPRRTPLLTLAATAIGRSAARVLPAWATLRAFILTVTGLGSIDYGLWEWQPVVGLIGAGVSLLLLEYLTSSPGSPGSDR